jgi:hypothetical protein
MVLVPCYPGIPESELRLMAEVLIRVEKETSLVQALKVTVQPADTMYSGMNALPTTPQACADSALAEP